ncbi:DUF2252 family protein [Cupriavidus necator]
MHAASDVFLGWTRGRSGRHFYIRQLRDMSPPAVIEDWDACMLRQYGRMCAHTHSSVGMPVPAMPPRSPVTRTQDKPLTTRSRVRHRVLLSIGPTIGPS